MSPRGLDSFFWCPCRRGTCLTLLGGLGLALCGRGSRVFVPRRGRVPTSSSGRHRCPGDLRDGHVVLVSRLFVSHVINFLSFSLIVVDVYCVGSQRNTVRDICKRSVRQSKVCVKRLLALDGFRMQNVYDEDLTFASRPTKVSVLKFGFLKGFVGFPT